mgnify:CR=1 FL=1
MYSGVSRTGKLCIAKGRAMAVIDVRIDITGMTPLLMHSDRLADPLLPESKAFKRVTSKRTKTDVARRVPLAPVLVEVLREQRARLKQRCQLGWAERGRVGER